MQLAATSQLLNKKNTAPNFQLNTSFSPYETNM